MTVQEKLTELRAALAGIVPIIGNRPNDDERNVQELQKILWAIVGELSDSHDGVDDLPPRHTEWSNDCPYCVAMMALNATESIDLDLVDELARDYEEEKFGIEAETFEADNIKAALRLERKAAKERSKLAVIRADRVYKARQLAQAQAWRIYCRQRDDLEIPRAWRFMRAGSPHMACKELPKETTYELNLEIETEAGRGVLSWWRSSLVGVIENGAGFVMAVVIHHGGEESPKMYAVAVCEGEAACEPMPGWTADMFPQSSRE